MYTYSSKINYTLSELLNRQMNLELKSAAQSAYFSGILKDQQLCGIFNGFAKSELEHFRIIIRIIRDLDLPCEIEPAIVDRETDPVAATVMFKAIEQTMILYYEDILPYFNDENRSEEKKLIANLLDQEKNHLKVLENIIEESKNFYKSLNQNAD